MLREIYELLKIEGSLFVLFIISSIFNFETFSQITASLFVLIPIIYIGYKLIMSILSQKLFNDRQDYFLNIIEKHVPVLYRKKQLSIRRNDYGLLDVTWWRKEKIKLLSYLNNQHNLKLNDQDYLNLIDYAVDNYIEENQTLNQVPTNPYEYEEYCANLLNKNEWVTETTKKSGDHGVDVIAMIDSKRIAIQCKLYNSNVGNKAVQEVVTGMKYWDATIAVVVTNSKYTKPAIDIARVHNVYLLHHDDLHELDIILRNPPVYLS
ncbi:restriction endonuclease [Ignatzschineria sp. LJL83]